MTIGSLAVIEGWLDAVNRADARALLDLTADDVEIVGTRGVGRGRDLLAQWLARAGFSAQPRRWFCHAEGRVVVEQDAQWRMPDGAVGSARVASAFVVRDGRVARFERCDALERALEVAEMEMRDEVTVRRA